MAEKKKAPAAKAGKAKAKTAGKAPAHKAPAHKAPARKAPAHKAPARPAPRKKAKPAREKAAPKRAPEHAKKERAAPVVHSAAEGAVAIVDGDNRKVSEHSLRPEVFAVAVNEHLLYEAVKQYRATARRGTHMTKTKVLKGLLDRLGVEGKTLLVEHQPDRALLLSGRNIPGLKVIDSTQINVYDVLDCPNLVVSQDALDKLEEQLTP